MVAVTYGTSVNDNVVYTSARENKRRNGILASVGAAAICLLVVAATVRPSRVALEQEQEQKQPLLSSYGVDAMMDPRGTDTAFVGKGDGSGTSVKMNAVQMLGTNSVFLGKNDGGGKRTKLNANQMLGTNAAFLGKSDGAGQSTKARTQSLWDVPPYVWSADMEGTYLPSSPALTGEGTKQISLVGPAFANPLTDETNLGGIPGDGPANILPGYRAVEASSLKQLRSKMQSLAAAQAPQTQALWDVPPYVWSAEMEGTYLPSSPVLTGEGTKQISLVGPPFANAFTDETNLGGIPGKGPANILPGFRADGPSALAAAPKLQSLWDAPKYVWSADMEGTYLPSSPVLTGEGTKQISLVGPAFANPLTDETNLGGIPGDGPANVLTGY